MANIFEDNSLIKSRQLQAGEIEHYEVDKRYIKPDGSIVWVHMVVAPLNSESAIALLDRQF